jgi:hypothetical protein
MSAADITIDISQLEASQRYMDKQTGDCLCKGRYSNESSRALRHVVWLAFDCTGTQSASISPNGLGWWITRAAVALSGSTCVHTQFVFYDHERKQFYSYGADYANGVFCTYIKTFQKPGWRFIELEVTQEEEVAIRRALIAEVGKPFAIVSALLLFFYPLQLSYRSWLCSSLALYALQRAGLATNAPPPHTVAPHRLMSYLEREYPGLRVVLENNLIVISDRAKSSGRQTFIF